MYDLKIYMYNIFTNAFYTTTLLSVIIVELGEKFS